MKLLMKFIPLCQMANSWLYEFLVHHVFPGVNWNGGADESGGVCVWGGSEAALESVLVWASAGVLFHFFQSVIIPYIYWSITSVLPSAGWLPLTLRLTERKTTCGPGSPSLRELLSLFSARAQLKPSPAPFGLWDARIGSVMPLPSGPRPDPGVQPILCSIRFPTFDSGRGAALSPTTPERDTEKGIICIKL